jgi:hypothetical protein
VVALDAPADLTVVRLTVVVFPADGAAVETLTLEVEIVVGAKVVTFVTEALKVVTPSLDIATVRRVVVTFMVGSLASAARIVS